MNKGATFMLLILCLFALLAKAVEDDSVSEQGKASSVVGKQDFVPDIEATAKSLDVEEGPENKADTAAEAAAGREEFLKKGQKPKIKIDIITPSHGPVTGETRVVVRGQNFAKYMTSYPEPKCRFGSNSMIVGADWISCTEKPQKVTDREATKKERTATCIQCELSPASLESKPVEFSVSLTGDFTDVTSSANFYYYKASRVTAIKPIHGPKDGGTNIQVWGENFESFGEDTSCSFGTKKVRATVHSSNYITCTSPASDVVQRAMPFGVSLNGQQQSRDKTDFWYYNNPQVTVAEPASGPGPGPESGGNEIVVRGNNFKPFLTDQGDPDISNSTQCAFTALNVWTPAIVLNSTRAICIAPPSYYYKQTAVELSLNAQDWTDDGTMYFYYKPPFLFDVQPPQGPVFGGTKVTVIGSNFTDSKNITCKFGYKEVPAKFKSSSEITCVAPTQLGAGYVNLAISFIPGLYSSPVLYLYYQTPTVSSISPISGPDTGLTQLTVEGVNFLDLGRDSALCVFNKTLYTNATVMSETQIICDTPSLLNKLGFSEYPSGSTWQVGVSLDGGLQISDTTSTFKYYQNPTLTKANPALGPLRAGTTVTLTGTGFAQQGASKRLVRLGHMIVEASSYTNTTLTFTAPNAMQAGTTVISVSLNGQQFTSQSQVHAPSKSVTFDYYKEPYVSLHTPSRGPNNGGTLIKVQGYGFALHRPHLKDQLWAKFVDISKTTDLSPAQKVDSKNLLLDGLKWYTPAVKDATDAILQISLNGQDWHDVKDPSLDSSFSYYMSPKILQVTPSFGHVKATMAQTVEVKGSGFECFSSDCAELKCRFGNSPDSYIFVQGELLSAESIKCKVPQYTKPDVLNLEITINGESYTSDNNTYGFFDPYVLDAKPRLISTDGSTTVAIQGIGFVDSGQAKALFRGSKQIVCGGIGAECSKKASFQDKRTLITSTFAQSDMKYKGTDKSVLWDAVSIDATVIGDEYTQNGVEVFYYQDPKLLSTNIQEAPANLQAQLVIKVDFGSNDKSRLDKYANPSCRFTFGSKVVMSEGQLVSYPFTAIKNSSEINAIHCKTPKWQLDGAEAEKANLDISLNGQNFVGSMEFMFMRPLKIHRSQPMSGPQRRQTQVRTIGQGYRLKSNKTVDIKWGTQTTDAIKASKVLDFTYAHDTFIDSIPGAQCLRAYETEARGFVLYDTPMVEGGAFYEEVTKSSLLQSDATSLGGPAYVEVGIDEVLNRTTINSDGTQTLSQWVLHNYEPSSVEFYSYKEPTVQKMHPTSGLTKGGTFVEVIGTWFKYMPEYGIVPHCRFGDKIVRAHFDSSVRLVCQSPPNTNTTARLPFEISLNGVDWSSTGFVYSYYEEPVMTDIYPDMGSVQGGDEIFIRGDKFSNNTDPEEFKCRFSPVTASIPPKTIRARFINSTTIMCPAPGGWTEADRVILQVTWNGVDYDENHFQFSFYSIHKAFPRSGPSNGKGGDIVISGQGFRTDTNPSCRLNGTQWDPVFVNATQIRCPMPAAEEGESYFGNVDFAVSANGITWNTFEGGFQYYQQPIVEDIDPKKGPSTGVGIINFYGDNFRADYALAELGCKLGNAFGKAYYVSPRQLKCVVEDIPLLAEDEDPLPAQVSLNSYSFTEVGEGTYYRPYGVLQVSPSSIPLGASSTLIVSGKGFVAEEGVTPRCRFGTPADYAISEAEIMSYSRLACRAPESLPGTPTSSLPRDVPFAIALSGDEFAPWTASIHRMIFYSQPVVETVEPSEIDVGRITSVYLVAAEDSEFFDPVSVDSSAVSSLSQDGAQKQSQLSPLKCKFGRFGESTAVFINSTHIRCTTPPTDEPPDSIYKETVTVSVAMNGQDFLEDSSNARFTFVGTAPYISFMTIVLCLLAIAFVGFAAAMFTGDFFNARNSRPDPRPWESGIGAMPNQPYSRAQNRDLRVAPPM